MAGQYLAAAGRQAGQQIAAAQQERHNRRIQQRAFEVKKEKEQYNRLIQQRDLEMKDKQLDFERRRVKVQEDTLAYNERLAENVLLKKAQDQRNFASMINKIHGKTGGAEAVSPTYQLDSQPLEQPSELSFQNTPGVDLTSVLGTPRDENQFDPKTGEFLGEVPTTPTKETTLVGGIDDAPQEVLAAGELLRSHLAESGELAGNVDLYSTSIPELFENVGKKISEEKKGVRGRGGAVAVLERYAAQMASEKTSDPEEQVKIAKEIIEGIKEGKLPKRTLQFQEFTSPIGPEKEPIPSLDRFMSDDALIQTDGSLLEGVGPDGLPYSDSTAFPKGTDQVVNRTMLTPGSPAVEPTSLADRVGGMESLAMLEEDFAELPKDMQESLVKKAIEHDEKNSIDASLKRRALIANTKTAVANAARTERKNYIEAQNMGSLSEADQKRVVPIFDGQMATNSTEATNVNESAVSVLTAVPKINELLHIVETFDMADYADPAKLSELRGRIGTLKGFLIGDLRLPLVGPGALSQAELDILNSIVRDPTQFLSMKEGNRSSLQSLKAKIADSFLVKAKVAGIKDLNKMDPELKKLVETSKNYVRYYDSAEQAAQAGLEDGTRVHIPGKGVGIYKKR